MSNGVCRSRGGGLGGGDVPEREGEVSVRQCDCTYRGGVGWGRGEGEGSRELDLVIIRRVQT